MAFYFPPIIGGGVVVIVDLANKLAQLGHDITILTPDLEWNGEKYDPKINENITIHRVPTPSRSKIKIAARRCYGNMRKKGIELGKKTDYDFILTVFHPYHWVPKAAVSCGKKLNKPVIIKVDDAIYAKAKGLKIIQRVIEKHYNSKTLQNADSVLVMNEYTRDMVKNYYGIPKEKLAIMPNGVSLEKFHISNTDSKRIVFSGGMYNHRGIDILLHSAQSVIKKIGDAEFLLLGDGPEMQKLQKIVKQNNLSKNIVFQGWVSREKIPEFLAGSSIGIGPLRSTDVTRGALPIKVLEYMASGLPVLAAKGTVPEDVMDDGKNGYLVKDSKDLAEKIILLLEDDNMRKQMGAKSRKMAEKFDWENIVKAVIDKYQSISSR